MRPLTRMSATSLPCKFLQPIRNRSRRYRMICGGLLLPLRKPGPDGRTLRPLRAWTGFTGLNRPSKPRPEKAALKALATCFHQARNVFAVLISRASTARASVRRRQPGSGMVRCTSGKAPQRPASRALSCNCSICSRKGSLLRFVPRSNLVLRTPDDAASTCTFNKHAMEHRFCPTCGIHPYAEAADPKGNRMAAVNLRCLEGIDLSAIPVHEFDGRAV